MFGNQMQTKTDACVLHPHPPTTAQKAEEVLWFM